MEDKEIKNEGHEFCRHNHHDSSQKEGKGLVVMNDSDLLSHLAHREEMKLAQL